MLEGTYLMLGIESGLAQYMASTFHTVVSLRPIDSILNWPLEGIFGE